MHKRKITALVVTPVAVAAIGLTAACNPLPYGCHRVGSHGSVHCVKSGGGPTANGVIPAGRALHQPIHAPIVLARGSSWS